MLMHNHYSVYGDKNENTKGNSYLGTKLSGLAIVVGSNSNIDEISLLCGTWIKWNTGELSRSLFLAESQVQSSSTLNLPQRRINNMAGMHVQDYFIRLL